MAKNDGLILLLLGIGALYLTGKKKAPFLNGQFLSTGSMSPRTYYYRPISEPYPTADPDDFIEVVTSGIPSTTPGYHPPYQSKAYEYAWKSGRMTTPKMSKVGRSIISKQVRGIKTPSYSYDAPEVQTRIAAYKQYAELRKKSGG